MSNISYEKFREKRPKFSEPLQESEKQLWIFAQLALMEEINKRMYGMAVNGTCQLVLTESNFNSLKEEIEGNNGKSN